MIKLPETAYQPCPASMIWLKTQNDIDEAWRNCPKTHWMMWALRNVLPRAEKSLTHPLYRAFEDDKEYTDLMGDAGGAMEPLDWEIKEEQIRKRIILEIYPTWPGPR